MTKVILNESVHKEFTRQVVAHAKSLLNDEGDYLESIINLSSLRHNLCEDSLDEDFVIFVAVESETDHIPYGRAREKFSSEWLRKCEEEIEKTKSHYNKDVIESCRKLVARFG